MTSAPLRVSSNGRYFVDAHGEPFFWLGDTAWPLFTEYSPEDSEKYLKRRSEQGFSVIKGGFGWSGGALNERGSPLPNFRGEVAWLNENPATPNLPYYEYAAHLIRIAAEHNLIVSLIPTWGYYINDVHWFNVGNAEAYGNWLGSYFREFPNLMWCIGGDREPRGYEEIHLAMAYGLRNGHGGAHLMSYHSSGGTSSSRYFHSEDWLAFNVIQTWDAWQRIYSLVTADMLRTPAKPVVMDEGAYEAGTEYPSGPITPLLVRKQAWLTFMAGGCHTYGHNDLWRMTPHWIDSLETEGVQQLQQFKAIATSRDWWKMTPYQPIFLEGAGSGRTQNAALRSEDATCAMIYLSDRCHVLLNLTEIDTRQLRATWFNPANGQEIDAGAFETGNRTGASFPKQTSQWFSTPPFWQDAVLVLDGIV